jgi:hypothetical protein
MQNVIVRLYYWLLLPFFWTTRLGREYTAIIGWSLRCMFKGDLSRQSCIRAFHAHNESVRASVPAERLLLWRPQDGWEPLARCASLTRTGPGSVCASLYMLSIMMPLVQVPGCACSRGAFPAAPE